MKHMAGLSGAVIRPRGAQPCSTAAISLPGPPSPALPPPRSCAPRAVSSASFRSASASRSEEHTSELQSLMRISYAVFCLQKKNVLHLLFLVVSCRHILYECKKPTPVE